MLRKISLFQFAILLSILFCSSVGAQDNPESKKPWKRFSLKLGAALGSTDTSVRLGTQGLGLNLNLEDLLGVEQSASTIRLEGFWRFAPRRRHRLDFTWFSFSRTGFNSINQAIDIGDITIPANANIRTELDVDVYRVGYSYSFFQDDRFDLAVATGLYVIPLRFQLDAEGLSDVFVSESITAPLPLIGLRVDVAITPKWFLRSSYDWFYLEFGDFRGRCSIPR